LLPSANASALVVVEMIRGRLSAVDDRLLVGRLIEV
jgi:hypothetical protein